MNRRTQFIVTAIALLALLAGALVYLWGRPPGRVYLLDMVLPARETCVHCGIVAGALPSFFHVYAFTLLTAALLASRPRSALLAGTIWFSVDALFEAAQHPALTRFLVPRLPAWFNGVPVLENVASYLEHGTFDPLDVLALALGAVAALLTLTALHSGGTHHGSDLH